MAPRRTRRNPLRTGATAELRPLVPGYWRIRVVGTLSFVGGATEAALLILVVGVAGALVRDADSIEALGVQVTLGAASALAASLLVVRVVALVLSSRTQAALARDSLVSTRLALLRGFLGSSWAERSSKHLGNLQELVGGHGEKVAVQVVSASQRLSALLNLTAFTIAALVVNPPAFLLIALVGALVGGVIAPIRSRARRYAHAYVHSNHGFSLRATETARMSREIQTTGVEHAVERSLARDLTSVGREYAAFRFWSSALPYLYQSAALGVVVAGIALLSFVQPTVNLESLGAVVLLLLRSLSAGQALVIANQTLDERRGNLDAVNTALDRFSLNRRIAGSVEPSALGSLTFDDVGFSYDDEAPAVGNLTFEIRTGESIGIIGPSGAGKTTLVQLMLRLRSPTEGKILAGGTVIDEITEEWWTSRVAFVPQDPTLISGTVFENVAFFRDVDAATVERALRDAHLWDEIQALGDGTDTLLSPGAHDLSGGQKQRLAIARALVEQPELIILDEPTSALDPLSEKRIQETLDQLHGDVTLIIVAHRLSTLNSCDRIMVLESGRLIAFDEHASLATQSSYYARALEIADVRRN
jgi:ATP-binding cassette, subfamily B, bacterial